jgi:hypothetical protein
MVVESIMSYAAFVWWQKSEQTTASVELQKVQKLACLQTTGAMQSAPTIALAAMLDLLPLPVMVKKVAAQFAFRMLDSVKHNTLDMQGHQKIYEDFQRVMDQHALSDKTPIRHDFEATFEVKIYERERCNDVPTEQRILMALGKMR